MNASQPLTFNPQPAPATSREQLTARIKLLARNHGLRVTAVTSAEPFPDVADHLDQHIDAGHMAGMDWFTKERGRFASDVRNLQSTAQSILSVALTYWGGPAEKPDDGIPRGRISRYAWGKDYHRVIKRRLKALHAAIEEDLGHPVESRLLVGPVGPDNETGVTSPVVCPGLPSSATVGGGGEGREERRANSPLLADRIAVCVQFFESPVGVEYFTQAQIDEIEATWAAYDQSDIPPPQITGYPDPATGSCAVEDSATEPGDGVSVDDGAYALSIVVRNCDSELTVFFTQPQEGCVPGDGAFFNVTSDSGEFLGNCEASINASNPAALYAGCVVQVPYGSTGVVTEDLASIPGYAPDGGNTQPFYAPPTSEPVDGEDYGLIFINVLQTGDGDGSLPTELPNTGVGPASDGSDSMLLIMALSSIATLLGFAALRVRQQA